MFSILTLFQELVLLKVADRHSPQVARPPTTDSLQQTRRLSGVVTAPTSGPVRIPEPYSSNHASEMEAVRSRSRTESLHSFSPDPQRIPFSGQRPDTYPCAARAPRDAGSVPYHSAAPIAASAAAEIFLNRYHAMDGFNPVPDPAAPMMSRSLDSKPSHFGPSTFYPATHGIASPAQILGPNRDISQVIVISFHLLSNSYDLVLVS